MKKAILTIGLAVASLLGANAFAQADKPGETKSVPAYKPSPDEKAQVNQERKAEGRKIARSTKSHADASPESMGMRKSSTKADRSLANAKRKSEGRKVAREPKDPTTGGSTN